MRVTSLPFDELIRKWIGERSIDTVAKELGCSDNGIRFLAQGTSTPPLSQAAKWAKVLGMTELEVIDAIIIGKAKRARDAAIRRAQRPVKV